MIGGGGSIFVLFVYLSVFSVTKIKSKSKYLQSEYCLKSLC